MEFRKYDLNQAKDGDLVMVKEYHAPVISRVGTTFVGNARVVVRWSDGVLTLFRKEEDHHLIHKPVYMLDGKPVYIGDTIYCDDGHVLVVYDNTPDSPPESLNPAIWSLTPKPRTLNINGFEVPYPETEAPPVGTPYWIVSLYGAIRLTWDGVTTDLEFLHEGFVHLSEVNAQTHGDALLSFFKVKD